LKEKGKKMKNLGDDLRRQWRRMRKNGIWDDFGRGFRCQNEEKNEDEVLQWPQCQGRRGRSFWKILIVIYIWLNLHKLHFDPSTFLYL